MEKLASPEPAHPLQGAGPVAEVSVAKTAGAVEDEAATWVRSKLFECGCMKRWLPQAYREELYQVLRLTGPLLLSRILNFLLPFVITIFCGHIGNAELAGYALASATINITTTATGYGLGVACDTLISQTFGSKNMKRVGVILQRGSLILLLFCLPCWAILINSYNLLILMHQEEEVARIAHIYVMTFLPAVPAMFLHQLQVAYLQNQGIIFPQMYTAGMANVFNVGFNYILIFSLNLGVVGSAIANSLSQITICLLLFGYIRWRNLHQQTWGGWSTECLQEWGSYMKLAIPSALMICFEWWIWELGGFFAGLLGEVDLAAQHVLMEIGSIVYMFPLGVHAAACVRVGNALGAGNTARALVSCRVALVLSGVLAVFQGIVIASCKSVIAFIFTSDVNIVAIVSENLTVYIFLQFFDALLCVCSGILVGSGMQKIAAISNLVGYYCIGLPVGIALMFAAKLRILGLWLGLLICVVIETVLFLVLIFKLNWKKVTQKAQLRAGKKLLVTPGHPPSTGLSEAMVPDTPNCLDSGPLDSGEAPKTDGYSPVNTQDQEVKAAHVAGDSNANARRTEQSKNTKPKVLLSATQLILRLGTTLLVSVLILIIGVAFYIAFPVPGLSAQSRANFTLNGANDSTPTPVTLNLTLDF
ncbi:multidrug and toxin extrusion protein 1-like [Archocentrus centrarchus]|uniref:multidrug and toxin extrusion protein 1-like n=1 Tax=Archocentrus centrarchus TaxID=63155 RepID=UPI0011EA1C46|nr:multidrug and toxin extrusion protein 1-like [Archocentrus centrarchus]